MTSEPPAEADGAGRRFTTTRRSLILSSLDAQSDDRKAREALAQLCPTYRRIFNIREPCRPFSVEG